MYISPQQ